MRDHAGRSKPKGHSRTGLTLQLAAGATRRPVRAWHFDVTPAGVPEIVSLRNAP